MRYGKLQQLCDLSESERRGRREGKQCMKARIEQQHTTEYKNIQRMCSYGFLQSLSFSTIIITKMCWRENNNNNKTKNG